MDNRYHYYRDRFYSENDKTCFPKTLKKLIKRFYPDISRLSVIEFGCGINPITSCEEIEDYLGIDISISTTELNRIQYNNEFVCADLTSALDLNRHYDLLIDSHLLHCLTTVESRNKYYQNILSCMGDQSSFILEVACFHPEVKFPFDYMFDGEVVFKMDQKLSEKYYQDGLYPYRWLPNESVVENELINSGFEIEYMMIRNDLRLEIFPDDRFSNINWPYIVQFKLSKKKFKPSDSQ